MANKSGSGIAGTVTTLLKPTVEELGYVLWDVEYVKEGAEYYLRITIDNEEGITLDDCEKVHRTIDPMLDEADPIEGSYNLEVSSPGAERDLKTAYHRAYCEGWDVEVRLYAPDEAGKKNYRGILGKEEENGDLHIEIDGVDRVFTAASVAKLKTVFDF